MEKAVQLLLDKNAVTEVQARYARTVDTKNWDMVKDIFAEGCELDYTSFGPDFHLINASNEDVANLFKTFFANLEASQHVFTNFDTEVEGDISKSVMYCRAQHYNTKAASGATYEVGGYYNIHYKRTENGWRIIYLKANFTWFQGNVGVCM